MTSEKALDMLGMIEFKDTVAHLHTWYKGIDDDMNEAVRMAVCSLKAWDKVKAEIKSDLDYGFPEEDIGAKNGLRDALAIIDRHLQEVENG